MHVSQTLRSVPNLASSSLSARPRPALVAGLVLGAEVARGTAIRIRPVAVVPPRLGVARSRPSDAARGARELVLFRALEARLGSRRELAAALGGPARSAAQVGDALEALRALRHPPLVLPELVPRKSRVAPRTSLGRDAQATLKWLLAHLDSARVSARQKRTQGSTRSTHRLARYADALEHGGASGVRLRLSLDLVPRGRVGRWDVPTAGEDRGHHSCGGGGGFHESGSGGSS